MEKRKRINGPLVKTKRSRLELSDLPMEILHSIVSRLPIREAVRTSILSKHWKRVWCCRAKLKFTFRSLVYKKRSGIPRFSISEQVFIQMVDAILKQHSGIGVEKMKVLFSPLNNDHAEHIDRWVQFAVASKTKQLTFDFEAQIPKKESYSFPFQIFNAANGSHLQSLKLGSVSLQYPSNIKFLLNLKKLELVDVNIDNDNLELMLSACNVLEFFGISGCKILTSLHIPRHSKHLKGLKVSLCPLLQVIELNSGLITLEYEGSLIPLGPPSTLRNICIKSLDIHSSIAYIFTELASTLPCLEKLTLKCPELKRTTLPNKTLKFLYLRHLRLELIFVSRRKSADVLDLAKFLDAAPLMEELEVHMWMDYKLERYRKHHGELRNLPLHPHSHLKMVYITGFYGQKDQLELALHVLRVSTALEAMKIDPRPVVGCITQDLGMEDGLCFIDGYKIARKYLHKADGRGVVDVVKVSRDVKNIWPCNDIHPYWLSAATTGLNIS
ncbi:hypothetical protein SORBI_3004G046700 [Sorghum bicolor]|uniref:F-box domain-containing protein n=1 Tax=Sorghum bicolor TaxID=4558 RepID=A0A1Z5RL54_SORBI|nr:hypothetical protein SORBI_3004G046700 [Sorghum bicolor]